MERRDTGRNRVLKSRTIEFNGGAIDCVVRNISPAGAALDVASPVGIPEHVTLVIAGSHERHACRVIWRKERRIGVAFSKS
jgi:PilZ domain